MLGQNPDNYKIANSYTEIFNGEEVFHVYNLEPTGFVMVSADRSVEPLLAFSYESTCNQTDRHPSVNAVLKSYSEQIAYAIKNGQFASSHTNAEWEHYSATNFNARAVRTVAPLLITKWNQGKYFNTACPEDSRGTDGHVVVGCVATAIAQIFNYFRYPTQGTGSYGYDHPDYGHLEVNFAEQHYDYDYMPVKPTDYNENLARLLYNIGVSVDMNYGPNGSGMTNHKGAYTMRNYFGYSDDARYIFKDSLPTVIPDNIENDTVIPDSIWNVIVNMKFGMKTGDIVSVMVADSDTVITSKPIVLNMIPKEQPNYISFNIVSPDSIFGFERNGSEHGAVGTLTYNSLKAATSTDCGRFFHNCLDKVSDSLGSNIVLGRHTNKVFIFAEKLWGKESCVHSFGSDCVPG